MAVFRNSGVLSPHYTPVRLIHREREMELLKKNLEKTIHNIHQTYPAVLQIQGGVGAGKTTLSLKAGRWLEDEGRRNGLPIRHIYVNLRMFSGGRVTIYRYIVRMVSEDIYSPSLSAGELLNNLIRYLGKTSTYALMIFDEVDHHVRQSMDNSLIYDFTRLPELAGGSTVNILGSIFISREGEFRKYLGRTELSSLGAHIIHLQPYNSRQVYDILYARAAEAFHEGAISDDILEFVAEKTASPPINGDIRFGLDVLLYAGTIAESSGRRHVGLEDVRKVIAGLGAVVESQWIEELKVDEVIALKALTRLLKYSGKPTASLEDIRRMCDVVAEEMGVYKLSNLRKVLQSLEMLGVIYRDGSGGLGVRDIDLASLERYLERFV